MLLVDGLCGRCVVVQIYRERDVFERGIFQEVDFSDLFDFCNAVLKRIPLDAQILSRLRPIAMILHEASERWVQWGCRCPVMTNDLFDAGMTMQQPVALAGAKINQVIRPTVSEANQGLFRPKHISCT